MCRTHSETICVRKFSKIVLKKEKKEFTGRKKKSGEWTININRTRQKEQEDLAEKQGRRWESGIK